MLHWSARIQAAMQRACHCLPSETAVEGALQPIAMQGCYRSVHHRMIADMIICTAYCVVAIMRLILQILGAEAQSRVPAEYITQQPTSANPPTLFLVLAQMANEIATASADDAASGRIRDQQLFLKEGEPYACNVPKENASAHMQLTAVLLMGTEQTHEWHIWQA